MGERGEAQTACAKAPGEDKARHVAAMLAENEHGDEWQEMRAGGSVGTRPQRAAGGKEVGEIEVTFLCRF